MFAQHSPTMTLGTFLSWDKFNMLMITGLDSTTSVASLDELALKPPGLVRLLHRNQNNITLTDSDVRSSPPPDLPLFGAWTILRIWHISFYLFFWQSSEISEKTFASAGGSRPGGTREFPTGETETTSRMSRTAGFNPPSGLSIFIHFNSWILALTLLLLFCWSNVFILCEKKKAENRNSKVLEYEMNEH